MSATAPGLALDIARVRFDERGLVPVIAQEVVTGAVLMLAWADREALERTLTTGEAWFYSRSRQRLWRKGETSGHALAVLAAALDCDGDTVLLRVRAAGPACHTGARTCFEPPPVAAEAAAEVAAATASDAPAEPSFELGWLAAVLAARRGADPGESYTARLLAGGIERVTQKVGEEATEVVIAALRQDDRHLVGEAADLIYHLLVLLAARDVEPARVGEELWRRHCAPSMGGPR